MQKTEDKQPLPMSCFVEFSMKKSHYCGVIANISHSSNFSIIQAIQERVLPPGVFYFKGLFLTKGAQICVF